MCPICAASAALVAGSVISAGGVSAVIARVLKSKKHENQADPKK